MALFNKRDRENWLGFYQIRLNFRKSFGRLKQAIKGRIMVRQSAERLNVYILTV